MNVIADLVLLVHLLVLLGLGAFALHRWHLARASSWVPRCPSVPDPSYRPTVTVQLPLFNEREVAARVIAAAGALSWPRDRLQIQVLDDSTDETCAVVDAAVKAVCAQGVTAVTVRRADRVGFKAGALEAGLRSATGEVIAIFDADFVPDADFLVRTVGHLAPDVGVVQTRWGHLNADESWLTTVQATMLDGHFVLEHGGRWRKGCWFNFNGTAGIWRRAAIEDAGGWQHDTLTEDLDLSYRAQLAGWRFVYLDDVVAPAELPPTMRAFKAQQHRWAKGGVQTSRKLLGRVLRAPLPRAVKTEASTHLLSNAGYPMTVTLAVLMPWVPWARHVSAWVVPWWVDLGLFLVCVVPLVLAYGTAVRKAGVQVGRRLMFLPVVLAMGVGMSLAQTRAAWEGLGGPVGVFERTPKRGASNTLGYGVKTHGSWVIELGFAAWQLMGVGIALAYGGAGGVPFLLLFAAGFTMVGGTTAREAMGQGKGGAP